MTSSPDPTHRSGESVQQDGGRPARGVPAPSRDELLAVRAREPEALGRFFDLYFPSVYGLMLRLLGNRSQAEDATQDVMVKVYRAVDRLDPERDPGPWITTIAYNVARDGFRSAAGRMDRQSASIDDRPELGHELRDGGPDPEEGALEREREQLVQEALMRLPEASREVIVLHDYHGLGHDRVAELIGVSHAAVRKRYSRALQSLAEILRETMDR